MDRKNEKLDRNTDATDSEEDSGQVPVDEEFLDWYFSPQSQEEVEKYERQKKQIRESQKRKPDAMRKAQRKYRRKKHGKAK